MCLKHVQIPPLVAVEIADPFSLVFKQVWIKTWTCFNILPWFHPDFKVHIGVCVHCGSSACTLYFGVISRKWSYHIPGWNVSKVWKAQYSPNLFENVYHCLFPHWAPLLNMREEENSIHRLPQSHPGGQQRWVTGPILPPSGRHLQKSLTPYKQPDSSHTHSLSSDIFWSPCSTDFVICFILYIDCLWTSFVVSPTRGLKCSPLLPWAAYLHPFDLISPQTFFNRTRPRFNKWLWSEGEKKIRTDCLRPPRHPSAQLDR